MQGRDSGWVVPAVVRGLSGRARRAGPAIVLAGVVLGVVGCGGGDRAGAAAAGGAADPRRAVSSGEVGSVPGGGTPPAGGQTGSVGGFTTEFARCMRAHGVPDFPDPGGGSGHLAPDSGIDPASAPFQAALTGPCRSLAPPPWLSAGPGSLPGGQQPGGRR
jgi:hypothetical protein